MVNDIVKKIEDKQATVGVVGLGYVGLPLAVRFASEGYNVIGFEKSAGKIEKINAGKNYIQDIEDTEFENVVKNSKLRATDDFGLVNQCNAIIICVPTPLDIFKKPDMSYIRSSCEAIGRNMKSGSFICLESTTYPTTTEGFMLPIIEKESGLTHGKDFWLAFSPERVDPGNCTYTTKNTPKIIGAITDDGLKIGLTLYRKVIDFVHPVSSPRVAEMVKILENTYRLINISLINEMALLCGKMDINIWEVIEAAKTKPYGFQAFYPGPGIGGHCIPLDPFYLEYIAKSFNFDLTMIHTAGHIDMLMPHRMTLKITSALNKHKKSINGSKILFLGVAYKPNIDDARESPALKLIDEVAKKMGDISYHDPYIANVRTDEGREYSSVELTKEILSQSECVVITTNHRDFSADFILENAKLVVDLRNAITEPSDKVVKL